MQAEATLRPLRAEDRGTLRRILEQTLAFSTAEIRVALELIDYALGKPGQTDYRFAGIERPDGSLAGYMCYGEIPLSDRCWDLYWIAVNPADQGKGLGRTMIRSMEEDLRRRGARKLFIETGGKTSYGSTRAFYEASGYREMARLPDFFAPGDDKVIFGKDLA
ncbi:MAG: GNAT family N-acetyltransferase [candidate division NC10 bacterium]|nr:GNAT family N-acetyltransferase [candidate division NC10 bacterium]